MVDGVLRRRRWREAPEVESLWLAAHRIIIEHFREQGDEFAFSLFFFA